LWGDHAPLDLSLAASRRLFESSERHQQHSRRSGRRRRRLVLREREKDGVLRQVEEHAVIDPGMAGLEEMQVAITVEMNPDGSVQSARIDPASMRDDPNWRLFAEDCRRAILRASPLKMPPDKPYAAWKTITLVFHGRAMTGQN
jgi:hypothetical protein